MKGKGINIDTLQSTHLYNDGHAVLKHTKVDKQAGDVSWAEVFELLGPATCNFNGRLTVAPNLVNLMKKASKIEVNNSGDLIIEGRGWKLPAISEGFTHEAGENRTYETIRNSERVEDLRISRRHTKKEVAAEAAAE